MLLIALLLLLCCVLSWGGRLSADGGVSKLLQVRGGSNVLRPDDDEKDYYDHFVLDYGCNDNIRNAGFLRGLVKEGRLANLPQSDSFLKWLQNHLEKGSEPVKGRLKPFYAADFGSKKDLKRGENPKLILVKRMFKTDPKTNQLLPAPLDIDVEVRNIWQPWLKPKCDFVVRYIVPNRVNICKIMEKKNRFRAELEVNKSAGIGKATAFMRMIFRPTLLERLRGKKDAIITYPVDASKLL